MIKTKEKFKQALDYVVTRIINWDHNDCILAIYFYGSYARNEYHADSDIDIYVQVEKKTDQSLIRELSILCNPDDYRLPEVEVKAERGTDRLMQDDLFHKNIRKLPVYFK